MLPPPRGSHSSLVNDCLPPLSPQAPLLSSPSSRRGLQILLLVWGPGLMPWCLCLLVSSTSCRTLYVSQWSCPASASLCPDLVMLLQALRCSAYFSHELLWMCGSPLLGQEYWGRVASSFSALSEISVLEKPCPHFPVISLGFGPLGTSGFSESCVRSVSPKTPILSMEILTVSACLLLCFWPPRQGFGQLLGAPLCGVLQHPKSARNLH